MSTDAQLPTVAEVLIAAHKAAQEQRDKALARTNALCKLNMAMIIATSHESLGATKKELEELRGVIEKIAII